MSYRNIDLISPRDMKPEDVIWLDGAAAGHPGIAVKTTHDEIKGMVAHLMLGYATHREQILMEFRGCHRLLIKTEDEKEVMYEDTTEWNKFCTDIAWMACFRAVLFNKPVMILSKKTVERVTTK